MTNTKYKMYDAARSCFQADRASGLDEETALQNAVEAAYEEAKPKLTEEEQNDYDDLARSSFTPRERILARMICRLTRNTK